MASSPAVMPRFKLQAGHPVIHVADCENKLATLSRPLSLQPLNVRNVCFRLQKQKCRKGTSMPPNDATRDVNENPWAVCPLKRFE